MRLMVLFVILFTLVRTSVWADTPLMEKAGTVVTSEDVLTEAMRIPQQNRKEALGKSESIQKIVNGLFVQRVIANEAERLGLLLSPEVIANLRLAKERILFEAYLQQEAKTSLPSDRVLDSLAQNAYKADSQRFAVPEQVRARHILLAGTNEETKKRAKTLLLALREGADFATTAKIHSTDAASSEKGGDLGFFSKGVMVAPFDAVVWSMHNVGELSDLVETQFGIHIIRFEGRRPAGNRPFEEVRDNLRAEAVAALQTDAKKATVQRFSDLGIPNITAIKALAKSQKN